MRPSSTGDTPRLASLPVPSTGASARVLACASMSILGAMPLEVEGIRELFLQGPISLPGSNAVVQIVCLKPEEVSAPRHGNHPERAPFGLCFQWKVLAKRVLAALVTESHRGVLRDCLSKHLLHSRLPP